MIVAGRPHKPNALGIYDGQDPKGRYTKRCIAFANDLGWKHREVCEWWSQIALAVEAEGGRPRPVAEDLAWHHVVASLRDLRMEATN